MVSDLIEMFDGGDEADVRIHSSGFLQAELPNGCKLHVWKPSPEFPKPRNPIKIHNHTSTFRSTVLFGTLRNIEYTMEPLRDINKVSRAFVEYEAVNRHVKGIILHSTGKKFNIDTARIFDFAQGSRYLLPGNAELFHESYPRSDIVVTMVESGIDEDHTRHPLIMVPLGSNVDNNFDSYAHTDYAMKLYSEIKELLQQ